MSPRVNHRIWDVVVRKIGIRGPAVERELQHLHARKAKLVTKGDDIRGDKAEIFDDERERPQSALHGIEDGAPWTRLPMAGRRSWRIGWYDPGCGERPEVVDAEHINLSQRGADAIDPPDIAGLGVALPVIDRISPELALRGEGVRRNAGDDSWASLPIQPEQVAVRPDIGAVVGNKDGQIADDGYAPLVCIATDLAPLAMEQELRELVQSDFVSETLLRGPERIALAQ